MCGMRQDSTRPAERALPALVLLLLVVAGLFVMHTIGHLGPHGPTATHEFGSHEMAADEAPVAGSTAILAGVSDQRVGQAPSAPALPLGAIAACVAVLCALTVLAVAVLLAGRSLGWRPPSANLIGAVEESMRGPPRPRIGFLIADLAVARN